MKRVVSSWRTLIAMLREIFDEAAYARFLARAGIATSSAAYAGDPTIGANRRASEAARFSARRASGTRLAPSSPGRG